LFTAFGLADHIPHSREVALSFHQCENAVDVLSQFDRHRFTLTGIYTPLEFRVCRKREVIVLIFYEFEVFESYPFEIRFT
jgi:hypothetical protein